MEAQGGRQIQVEITDTQELPDLLAWWQGIAAQDYDKSVPKIEEYSGDYHEGSIDLIIGGEMLALLLGWSDASSAVKQEMICWFYLMMKAARLVSNYQQREPGKEDTWHDISVYAMMARRLQETGRWP